MTYSFALTEEIDSICPFCGNKVDIDTLQDSNGSLFDGEPVYTYYISCKHCPEYQFGGIYDSINSPNPKQATIDSFNRRYKPDLVSSFDFDKYYPDNEIDEDLRPFIELDDMNKALFDIKIYKGE